MKSYNAPVTSPGGHDVECLHISLSGGLMWYDPAYQPSGEISENSWWCGADRSGAPYITLYRSTSVAGIVSIVRNRIFKAYQHIMSMASVSSVDLRDFTDDEHQVCSSLVAKLPNSLLHVPVIAQCHSFSCKGWGHKGSLTETSTGPLCSVFPCGSHHSS